MRRTVLLVLVAVLGVATVAVTIAAVVTVRELRHDARTSAAQGRAAGAVAVADRGVTALTTISPATSAATLERLEPSLTGAFRTQFTTMADTFSSVVSQGKVTSRGSIVASAVQSVTATRAEVLVAATAAVAAPKHQTTSRAYRIRVTLRRTGGAWRISGMEFVA